MINKFAVIGLGRFGRSIARTLASRGAEVLAIDRDEDKVESLKDEVAYAVALDSADIKALKSQNITDMDAVVVAIGENFEGSLLTTVLLLELEVKRVIVRAANKEQQMILEKLGVKEILSPEDEVGKTVAEILLHPNMKSFLRLPDDYEIVELRAPRGIMNKTVAEMNLARNYHLNLITVKRTFEEKRDGEIVKVEHVIGVPQDDTVFFDNDTVILLGKSKDVERFIAINN